MKTRKADLDRLKKYKGHDVQEQVALRAERCEVVAKYYRDHGIPKALDEFLAQRGVTASQSIFLDLEEDYPGCSSIEGTILTKDQRFIAFEMDLTPDRSRITSLHRWVDVTSSYKICESEKGIGHTDGFIAIQTLIKLNDNKTR